jgi:plastocyanin
MLAGAFNMTGIRNLLLAGLYIGTLLAAGNGSAEAASREHVVAMANMSFGKIPSDVKAGDTIVWSNRDTVPHTATARNKSFDIRVAPGKSARMVVKDAGTIPIYCIYHPAMRGTLKVAGS